MSLLAHLQASNWRAAQAAIPETPPSDLTNTAGAQWTALHFAAAAPACPVEVVEALLDAGASFQARAASGSTPLHLAAWQDSFESVKLLIARGADPNAATRAKRTPIHFASRRGHAPVVTFLLESGAAVNQQDAKGMTALHFAADGGHVETATLLIEAGAKCIPANDGRTPIDIARGWGNSNMADVLRAAFGDDGQQDAGVDSMSRRISDAADMPTLPWLSGRLTDLTSRASAFAKSLYTRKPKTEVSLSQALSGMTPSELAGAMAAYAVKGQDEEVASEYKELIHRGVEKYCLTGSLLLASMPEPEVLVQEMLEAGGLETEHAGKGALYHTLVNFVRGAREAKSGTLVQRTEQSYAGILMRKEVYVAVGAGVLFSLLIPLARK